MMETEQMQNFTKNLAISASAGTGKTYQLSMRYISLLLHGAKPDQLVAITFSKKAAAEIFDKIIRQLVDLIQNESVLHDAIQHGFLPPETKKEMLSEKLGNMLSSRKKLHIETNDSFLMQILQGAPAEFGISGEISMVDENDDRPRQYALLQTLQTISDEDPAQKQELYYALRDCSFGDQKTSLYSEITKMMKEYYETYLSHPSEAMWIVPDGEKCTDWRLSAEEFQELSTQFNDLFEVEYVEIEQNNGLMKKFSDLLEEIRKTVVVADPPRPNAKCVEFFLGEKLNVFASGPIAFSYGTSKNNQFTLGENILQILRKMVLHLASVEHELMQKKTKAVFYLMDRFRSSYDDNTKKAGKLTFSDILYLLNHLGIENFGLMMVLQERLAMSVNHYLLDEFQDTSDAQWDAIKNLMDDAITWNDPSVLKTFFMVGDAKQSIYQWREGNPKLFGKICQNYKFRPDGSDLPKDYPSVVKGLTKSYRSATPVLQLVNLVFGTPDEKLSFPNRLSEAAEVYKQQRTAMNFQPHESGLGEKKPDTGCAMIFEVPKQKESDPFTTAELTYQQVCELIRKLDPFTPRKNRKPLSVGVLFRKNDNILACYETIRHFAPELNVSMEGKLTLKESMGYSVFRQLIRYAVHPGDQTAPHFLELLRSEHCTGSIENIRESLFPGQTEALPDLVRQEIRRDGYLAFFQHFRKAFPETEKESEYMELLETALIQFEKGKKLPDDELLAQLDEYTGLKRSVENTVQLMTIHKSKGLEFDVLILPDLADGKSRPDPLICTGNQVYFSPAKVFQPLFAAIAADEMVHEADECYEKNCNLYVALTRAARGIYLFLPEIAEDSTAKTMLHSDMIRAALPQKIFQDDDPAVQFANSFSKGVVKTLYSDGDLDWIEHMPEKGVKSVNEAVAAEKDFLRELNEKFPAWDQIAVKCTEKVNAAPPSAHKANAVNRFASMEAAELGTAVHEVLSQLQWTGTEAENAAFLANFDLSDEARSLLSNALNSPAIRDALARPDGKCRLLREQPFLMRNDAGTGEINGIMDRAVIRYDERDVPVSAEVIDYKTDRVEQAEKFRECYEHQLQIYRKALAKLTGLPEEKIRCTILALRPGLAVPIP